MPQSLGDNKLACLAVAAAATTAAVAVGAYLYERQKRKSREIPTDWEEVAIVTHLNIYPLKSGRRVEVKRGDCTFLGMKQAAEDEVLLQLRDRSFIVYDVRNNELKTARTFPKMVLIETSVDDRDQVAFDAPGADTLCVKLPKTSDKHVKELHIVSHHNEKIWGLDCGNAAAEWFSKYMLDKPSGVRLAFHDGSDEHRRNISNTHKKYLNVFPNLSNKSTGMFSDLTSYHMVNQSSVNELNSRLDDKVSVNNFRPPIVFEGNKAPAYCEDAWDWIRIGDEAVFRTAQPCTRCMMTTIDQETGERSPKREPLKTMEGYRRLPNKKQRDVDSAPVMGMLVELIRPGRINIGDKVYHCK